MTESNRRRCCCGTLAQQEMRIAKFDETIERLAGATGGDSRRKLRHAQETKARIQKWIAAHSHAPAGESRVDPVYHRVELAVSHAAGNGA